MPATIVDTTGGGIAACAVVVVAGVLFVATGDCSGIIDALVGGYGIVDAFVFVGVAGVGTLGSLGGAVGVGKATGDIGVAPVVVTVCALVPVSGEGKGFIDLGVGQVSRICRELT